jgi:hypothetical protein
MALTKVQSELTNSNVNVKDYGAVGDGATDDAAAIQAAIDSLTGTGGTVVFPVGNYYVGATITISQKDTVLQGSGGAGDHNGLTAAGATVLTATHSAGPVVRITYVGCSVRDMSLSADATRKAGATGSNYGLQVQGLDTGSGSGAHTFVENVRVTNQPHHGIMLIARMEASLFQNVWVDQCDGHGWVIDDGSITSMTNVYRIGQINMTNCSASRCGGHGIKMGDASDVTNWPYRIIINNFESVYNRQDSATYTDDYDWVLFGENISITNSACNGTVSSAPTVGDHAGIRLDGKNIVIHNHRFVNCGVSGAAFCAQIRDTNAGTAWNTEAITISNCYVNNQNESAGYYNPAFSVITTCQNVKIKNCLDPGGDITALASSNSVNYDFGELANKRFRGRHMDAVYSSTPFAVSLADDRAGYFEFDSACYGVVVIGGNTNSAGPVMLAFRCGDANKYIIDLAQASSGGPTLELLTTALTNGGDTDGRLQFSAVTSANRIYIGNRTGGAKAYHATFLSLSAGSYLGFTAL